MHVEGRVQGVYRDVSVFHLHETPLRQGQESPVARFHHERVVGDQQNIPFTASQHLFHHLVAHKDDAVDLFHTLTVADHQPVEALQKRAFENRLQFDAGFRIHLGHQAAER